MVQAVVEVGCDLGFRLAGPLCGEGLLLLVAGTVVVTLFDDVQILDCVRRGLQLLNSPDRLYDHGID